jgi:hypothetical protein
MTRASFRLVPPLLVAGLTLITGCAQPGARAGRSEPASGTFASQSDQKETQS